jgi:GT2 family glycosyltransferase
MPKQFKKLMETSTDQKVNISIIIPNYRSKHFLKNNLASIYGKIGSQAKIEVIIINNDEKEDLEDIKKEFQEIIVVNHKKNVGFGAAVNIGAGVSSGEYLFLLNPDCEIISDSIKKIIDEFRKNADAGIVGSQLVGPDDKVQKWSAGKEINILNLIKNNIGFSNSLKIRKDENKTREVHWVAGTAMFIAKELFAKAGGFDENFFMYFEDADLCKRVRKMKKKVYLFPHFKVKHFSGGSYENKKAQKANYFNSQEYYFKKHNGKFEHRLLKFLHSAMKIK